MAKKAKILCVRCGDEMTENNSFYAETESGFNPYCTKCQQAYFERLQAASGTHLAIYQCCIKYDVPCNPLLLPENVNSDEFLQSDAAKDGIWIYYLRKIEQSKLYDDGEDIPNFFDGVTNILRIFGKNFTERDFAKFVQYEQDLIDSLEGTERQRERWGDSYTEEEYNELDRLYESRKESYKGVTLTAQMEDTLIKVCRWNLKIDQYIESGNIKLAKDLQSMVETALASESMRKKDEKPVEAYSIDAQVKALEDAGLMEDGKFLNLDGVQKSLIKHFIKKKKYDYPIDVLDHVIEDIWNTMRENADAMISTELPSELKPTDEFGEFEEKETEEYEKVKKFAGLTKVLYQETD